MSVSKKGAAKPLASDQEIQQTYTKFQSELQALSSKIGELEAEADEHNLVLTTLEETLAQDPDRKCFRLIGGVLVERTVKEVAPALKTNRDGIQNVIGTLVEQFKSKEQEFDSFKREYNVRPVAK
ncbi:Prefoldin beta-like protein [Mycena floridula]|nr:Prefoldin beta-like protein [Mycena floridula]